MKTTEVFVDQVLIGFLVIAIVAVPFWEEWPAQTDTSLVGVLVGVAYLLGILFDRFSDTLLSRLEQRQRIKFIRSLKQRSERHQSDPFPEDLLLAKILAGGPAAEWVDYLRSRARLSRAVAALLPALTLSIGLALAGFGSFRIIALAWVGIVYGPTAGVLSMKAFTLPKTYEVKDSVYAPLVAKIERRSAWCDATLISVFFPFSLLTIAAVKTDVGFKLLGLDIVGLSLTVLALSTWLRIRETLMRFLWTSEAAAKSKTEKL